MGEVTMPFSRVRGAIRYLTFGLSCFLVGSGSLLYLACGVHSAYPGESAQGELATQEMDMDHHDHMGGAIESMIPHQRHTGPHMKWTALRPADAEDVRRADEIVHTLHEALAKYKDYRVALSESSRIIILRTNSTGSWRGCALIQRHRPRSYTRKPTRAMSWKGQCIPRREV